MKNVPSVVLVQAETLGESYAHETDSGSPHLWVISVPVPVSVSVSVLAFPCFALGKLKVYITSQSELNNT